MACVGHGSSLRFRKGLMSGLIALGEDVAKGRGYLVIPRIGQDFSVDCG
jgi:hypothetical protein